jgi:murein DD-endopeptidase MepM/ murein hydrolase activator NlpD
VPAGATALGAVATAQAQAPAAGAPVQEQQAPRLSRGDRGPEVEALQEALLGRGEAITVDGDFGPMTEAAVERVQRQLGLPVSGLADAALLDALDVVLPTPPVCRPGEATGAQRAGLYLKAFPIAGAEYRYANDYGAGRQQGSHEGVDVLAARGVPVLAVVDGSIARMSRQETGLGGIWIWLEDDDGNTYYYAHLDAILKGIEPGVRVAAGQQIATNGNTGDARFGAHHVHFEIHPGGAGAINPYQALRAVDPLADGGDPAKPVECAPPDDTSGEAAPTPVPEAAPTEPVPPIAPSRARPTREERGPAEQGPPTHVELSVAQLRINQRISQAALRRINQVRARLGGPTVAIKERAPGVVRLTVQQILINQRISQAALRRVRELEALFTDEPLAPLAAPDAAERARAAASVTLSPRQLLINQRISQAAVRRVNALQDRLPKPRASSKAVS